jgi:hypothetical protein
MFIPPTPTVSACRPLNKLVSRRKMLVDTRGNIYIQTGNGLFIRMGPRARPDGLKGAGVSPAVSPLARQQNRRRRRRHETSHTRPAH